MPSSTEKQVATGTDAARGWAAVKRWNARLHHLLGLYLLLFVWFYFFTGLLLNHSQWKFAEFWDSRQQSRTEHDIVPPAAGPDLEMARDIMKQLGVRGEVEWTATRQDSSRLDFRVSRPGHILEIKADLGGKKASIQRIDLNAWGVMRILHAFTGVRLDDPRNHRDWLLTSVWALSMDAVALGLLFTVVSSLVMWCDSGRNRVTGAIVLVLGLLSCGVFCFGLRWFC